MSKQMATAGRRRENPSKRPATRRKPVPAVSHTRAGPSRVAHGPVHLIWMLAVGLVVGALLSSGLRGVFAGQTACSGSWQYGRFSTGLAGASWSTPDRHYAAEELEELYGYIASSQHQGEITAVELVNLIGSHGWELVSVSAARDARDSDNYWFKRR